MHLHIAIAKLVITSHHFATFIATTPLHAYISSLGERYLLGPRASRPEQLQTAWCYLPNTKYERSALYDFPLLSYNRSRDMPTELTGGYIEA